MFSRKKMFVVGASALVGAMLIITQTAASRSASVHYKLGGAWVGELDGVQWVSIHTPLDAAGKTAAGGLQWINVPEEFKALHLAVGSDRNSEAVGTFQMISKDTATYTLVWYGVASGTLSPPVSDEIKAINVMKGTWRYTGPNSAESKETYTVYLPNGTGGTLLPGEGATVVYSQDFDWHPVYRLSE